MRVGRAGLRKTIFSSNSSSDSASTSTNSSLSSPNSICAVDAVETIDVGREREGKTGGHRQGTPDGERTVVREQMSSARHSGLSSRGGRECGERATREKVEALQLDEGLGEENCRAVEEGE
jgi:hypothetical protein